MSSRTTIRSAIKKNIAYKQEYKCKICSKLLPPSHQCDHIVPHSISNDNNESNLQILCPTCHANKTLFEQYRIGQYKKLKEEQDRNMCLCWFCLEFYDLKDKHTCDKTIKDIDTVFKERNELIKFSFQNHIDNLCKDLEDTHINEDELLVIITENYIQCKHIKLYFEGDNIDVDTIANVIDCATRTKKDSRKYTQITIRIKLYSDEYTVSDERVDKCADHIIEYLPDMVPGRILKDGDLIINVE